MASYTSPYRSELTGLRVAVAGAGVLGLSIAGLAARAGARVTVFDPRPLGENASGVAAGMLAPALEAALDPEEDGFPRLSAGLLAWPRFADTLRLGAPRDLHAGALYLGAPERLDEVAGRLEALGAAAERLTAEAARALQPALAPTTGEALHVRGEGRVEARATLRHLAEGVLQAGGEIVHTALPPGFAEGHDETVLAAGYRALDWLAVAPELAGLQPIKGHVLHFAGGPSSGPTIRTQAGYAAPQPRGVIFGATMEAGRSDLAIDPVKVAELRAAAQGVLPALADMPFQVLTGVRAATPDGAALVGRSAGGVLLAVGARRNGWLLAPLIAQEVVQALSARGR